MVLGVSLNLPELAPIKPLLMLHIGVGGNPRSVREVGVGGERRDGRRRERSADD